MSATIEMPSDPGLSQLKECLGLILSELRELRAGVARPVVDETRPLTALELCERWHVEAPTEALRLLYLSRKCRAWGLRALEGTKGWSALYGRADVLHAESFASGKLKRRKHA
jgi:hypothetical protein